MLDTIIKFFQTIGIDLTFIAGIAGGVTSLTKQSGMSKKEQFIIVLSGGFTANYLTPLVAEWLNLSDKTVYGIGFLLGYAGLKSVEVIIRNVHRKLGQNDNTDTKQ